MNTRTPQVGDVYTSKSGDFKLKIVDVSEKNIATESEYGGTHTWGIDDFLLLAAKSIELGSTFTPAARATDPDTSREAAESVQNLRQKQADVLRVLGYCKNGSTHEDFAEVYNSVLFSDWKQCPQSESGLRTRLCELVRMGLVEDSGRREKTASGRRAIVWRVRK